MTRYRIPAPPSPWPAAPFHSTRLVDAFHESAHALVAMMEGIPVESVSLGARGGGECRCGAPRGEADKVAWLRAKLRIGYAGMEAARWISPHTMFRSSRSDRANLDEMAASIGDLIHDEGSARFFVELARQEAARIINELWPLIEKLAKELNRRGSLTGDQIWELFGGKPAARRPGKPSREITLATPIFERRCEGHFI
jgi:ATP-dependent Zn protease